MSILCSRAWRFERSRWRSVGMFALLCGKLGLSVCWAANGMVAAGNGAIQLGMAGAGTAMAQDPAAILRNPAAAAWLDSGMAANLSLAVPEGGYKAGRLGPNSPFGLLDVTPGRDTSVSGVFPIPDFARNWRLDERNAVGWGLSASGMSTLARGNTATLARGIPVLEARCNGDFGGGGPLSATTDLLGLCGRSGAAMGVSLAQILVEMHWANRVLPGLSVGVAPVVAVQRVNVRGLGAFAAFSNDPDKTSDEGNDYSFGGGARIGVLWDSGRGVGLGASYQSRLYQTAFDRYRGSVIGGSLDLAPILDIGLQIHFAAQQRLLIDVERIWYGDIKPLANRVDPQRFADRCFVPRVLARNLPQAPALDDCLGGPDGPGFGWRDVTVYKFGYQGARGRLSWRAGYSFGGNPVGKDQILSATFAPAITKRHAAAGLSWKLRPNLSLDWTLLYAIANTVRVPNALSSVSPTVASGSTLVGFRVDMDADDQVIESHMSAWQSGLGFTWVVD